MSETLNIGLITPIVDGFYFGGLIDSISSFYKNINARLFIMQSSKHTATQRLLYNFPLALDYMDGWIILPQAVFPEFLDTLCKTGKPVTMVSKEINNSECQFILTDNFGGMESAVEHLIDHGHKSIAFAGWLEDFDVRQRFEGYKSALEKRGIEFSEDLIINVSNCIKSGGHEAAEKILASSVHFTAVATGTDFNAMGMIQRLKESGFRIPEDIAVVSFDNTNAGEKFEPALTSIDQSIHNLGKATAKCLYDRIKNTGDFQNTVYVNTDLVLRNSCGCKTEKKLEDIPQDITNNQNTIEFLSEVIQSSFGIGNSLINSSSDEIKSLSWIKSAGFHWACLGLFDKQKRLVADRFMNMRGSSKNSSTDMHYKMESFPPLNFLKGKTKPENGDIVWLHPICTESHEWGVLVLVGPFLKSKLNVDFDTMTHLFDLLSFALELEASSENRYRSLLNSTDQGFLSFGKDLVVDREYSSECRKIFGADIKGFFLPELVYPDDVQQQTFLKNIIYDLMVETNENKLNMYLGILPDEILISGRNIKIEFKLTEDYSMKNEKKCMLILTDITDKRKLESKIEYEKNILKMVIQAIINYNDFMETSKDYVNFCRITVHELIESKLPVNEICYEIFRCVHTFKGNFSQFDMVNVVQKLHAFESEISEVRKNTQNISEEDFKKFIFGQDMVSWLKSDIETLKGILGEQFFNNDFLIVISDKKFKELEKKCTDILLPSEYKKFMHELRKLRYKSFKELLSNYPEYTRKLSLRLNKSIYFHDIEQVQEIPVDAEFYHDFTRSLVNVFRNMVEHGIELPDERINSGKDEFGIINCVLERIGYSIHIKISDDGRGIDFDKIRQKKTEDGFYDMEEIDKIPDEELIKHIFEEEFSTKITVTDLSGRGMGLSAVKKEVDKLGGKIEVESKKNEGTTFHFYLPIIGLDGSEDFNIENFTSPIFETAKNVLCSSFGLEPLGVARFRSTSERRIALNKITSFIKIKGFLNGKFFLSVDTELAEKMVHSFILENVSQEEENLIIEDVLSECTNTILGNSLGLFGKNEEFISIETPETIFTNDGYIKYSESNICICNLKFKEGNALLCLCYHEPI